MPFAKAHYYLAGFFLLVIAAFFPMYFGNLSNAPAGHHMHGVTATLWILLLMAQSWSIHNKKRDLHKTLGKACFIIIPLFLGGGMWVLEMMVSLTESPFTQMFGMRLAASDFAAVVLVAACLYQALKNRRNVDLHARFMIVTLFPLIGPTLGRFFAFYVPGLKMAGPTDLAQFGVSINVSFTLTTLLALWWFYKDKKAGKPTTPMAYALAFMAFTLAFYYWLADMTFWLDMMAVYASISTSVLVGFGILLGIAVCTLGWEKGKK